MHGMESSDKSPELIIIAGPNGSGKTTFYCRIVSCNQRVQNFKQSNGRRAR